MNVTGVSAASQPPPTPPVARAPEAAQTSVRQQRQAKDLGAAAAEERLAEQKRAEMAKLPPLKPLSTTEIRMILGALPIGQSTTLKTDAGIKGGLFDAYV